MFGLKKNNIVGISGIDTRALTNLIRKKGSMKGTIVHDKSNSNKKDFYLEQCKQWGGLKGLDLNIKGLLQKTLPMGGYGSLGQTNRVQQK